jgi:hypothetical protein
MADDSRFGGWRKLIRQMNKSGPATEGADNLLT